MLQMFHFSALLLQTVAGQLLEISWSGCSH